MDSRITTPKALSARYRYLSLLGEGANGKTYLAEHKITGEKLAIKALKLSQAENFKSFDLFKREAEVLSSVHIRGVPKFYESIFSNAGDYECYLVQEYIRAPSLQAYLDKGRIFNENETLAVMLRTAEILERLESVYTPPIIHRDIKPSNILCAVPENSSNHLDLKAICISFSGILIACAAVLVNTYYSNPFSTYIYIAGFIILFICVLIFFCKIFFKKNTIPDIISPCLIDFGAVANPQKRSGGSTIAGTTGYMAPEQLMGECEIQSDYYALGATALHMLTGVEPWKLEVVGFDLQYETILKNCPNKISNNMKALLSILLNSQREKRPENAQILINMIQNVIDGHYPNAYPYRSIFSRIFGAVTEDVNVTAASEVTKKKVSRPQEFNELQLIDAPTTESRLTEKTTAIIRAYVMKRRTKNIHAEYTFDVGNSTYGGSMPLKTLRMRVRSQLEQQDFIKQYPVNHKCEVRYNPENPYQNEISAMEASKS